MNLKSEYKDKLDLIFKLYPPAADEKSAMKGYSNSGLDEINESDLHPPVAELRDAIIADPRMYAWQRSYIWANLTRNGLNCPPSPPWMMISREAWKTYLDLWTTNIKFGMQLDGLTYLKKYSITIVNKKVKIISLNNQYQERRKVWTCTVHICAQRIPAIRYFKRNFWVCESVTSIE